MPARVLDGGLVAWRAHGQAVEAGPPPTVPAGDITVPGPAAEPRLLWADLAPVLADPHTLLLDARSPAEYHGETIHPAAARGGHVPGAVNLPWARVLRGPDDPRLRPPGELRTLFATAGALPPGVCPAHGGPSADCEAGAQVVAMCQSGTRSAAVIFALRQAGFAHDRVFNYDGSWAEYSRLPAPVADAACPDGGRC